MNKELLKKHLTKSTRKPVKGEPRTYREKLLMDFLEKINECRSAGGFTSFTYARLPSSSKA